MSSDLNGDLTTQIDFDQITAAAFGTGELGPDLLSERAPIASQAGSLSSEPYKMRCPNCRKLYSVSRLSDDDVSRFECVGCQTTFYALRPHGEHVLQTSLLETQLAPIYHQPSSLPTIDGFTEDSETPSLEHSVRAATVAPVLVNADVRATELVLEEIAPIYRSEQARFADDVQIAENADLVLMWQAIMADYNNEAKHTEFVLRCYREKQLLYAAHKYAQLLVVAPQEDIARKMRARVQGLASFGFDETANGLSLATWEFPLPSFNNFIIFMGTVLVVVGMGFPHMRQTAWLGIAMIALAIGLRIFLRRPRS